MAHFYRCYPTCPSCGCRTVETIAVGNPTKYTCGDCGRRLVIESAILVKVRYAGRKSQIKYGIVYNHNDFDLDLKI